MSGPGASRRAVLRSGVLAVGALAGVFGLAGAAERLRTGAAPVLNADGATTLTLHGTEWHLTAPNLTRGQLPKRGDQVSLSGALGYAPDVSPVGSFIGSATHMDVAGHGPYAGAQLETHTFLLPEGTLVGIGSALAGQENIFAIVGGTGKYLGVTGSYIARQDPLETGGDGTAEFTLTLQRSGR